MEFRTPDDVTTSRRCHVLKLYQPFKRDRNMYLTEKFLGNIFEWLLVSELKTGHLSCLKKLLLLLSHGLDIFLVVFFSFSGIDESFQTELSENHGHCSLSLDTEDIDTPPILSRYFLCKCSWGQMAYPPLCWNIRITIKLGKWLLCVRVGRCVCCTRWFQNFQKHSDP